MNRKDTEMFFYNSYLPGEIICIGMNYKSHIKEQDGRFPNKPILFSKARSCVIKNGDNILCPLEVKQLDYEVELGVIIAKKTFRAKREEAIENIYGYTIINDVTARDIQSAENQWYRSKSFATFAPIGPDLISKEKIKDPNNLNIRSYVNGELRQDSNTNDMIWRVYDLVAYISQSIILLPGDLIATGTPAGVALFREDKKFLTLDDSIECEIEGIGRLSNKIVFI